MQRYFAKENEDRLVLSDGDMHHIKNVMRMKMGDLIEVVYDSRLYICRIEKLDPLTICTIKECDDDNKLNLDVTMAIPIVKEQKMDLMLQKLTELGVNRIIPVIMERNIVKLDKDRFNKKKMRWEAICKEASEQSKRTRMPVIMDMMSVKELANIDADYKLIASTKEKDKMFKSYLQKINNCAKIIMVIGPEGGISKGEELSLNDNGFESVSFGNLIFRVETASIYAASIFNFYSSTR